MRMERVAASNGFRLLSANELVAVSGGTDTIIVTGERPDPWTTSIYPEDFWMYPELFGGGAASGFGDYGAGDGGGGTLASDPDASDGEGGCPEGMACTPVEGANDMYVRGEDGKLYFSETGLERIANGSDVNWWGVAADLAIIAGGALGAVGAGVIGVIAMMLGVTGAAIKETFGLSD